MSSSAPPVIPSSAHDIPTTFTSASTTTTTTTTTTTVSKSTLSAHLDALLARYLSLLDRHERLRAAARSHLRAGHLALAEANFRSANRAVRFGQDLYDDKARATLVLDVVAVPHRSDSDSGLSPGLGSGSPSEKEARGQSGGDGSAKQGEERREATASLRPLLPWVITGRLLPTRSGPVRKESGEDKETEDQEGEKKVVDEHDDQQQQQQQQKLPSLPTPPLSRESTPTVTKTATTTDTADPSSGIARLGLQEHKNTGSASSKPLDAPVTKAVDPLTLLPPDPIRQFGILVPPVLRAAQASFRRSLLGDGAGSAVGKPEDGADGGEQGRLRVAAEGEREGRAASREGWMEVAVLDAEMKALEVEVRRARKRLKKAREAEKGGAGEEEEGSKVI